MLKITGNDLEKLGEVLADLNATAGDVVITVLVSADLQNVPESVKKYMI